MGSSYPSQEQIKHDLKYLFDSLLHPESKLNHQPQATRETMIDSATRLLDCKQFVKDYNSIKDNPFAIHIWCKLELSDQPKEDPAPPAELIVLPLNATVADLKTEVTKAFQEVYAMFKRLEVEGLPEYGCLDDSFTLKFLFGLSGSIQIKGRCSSKHGLLRYRMERGTENWTVDCMCGAKDDDGERMLACDTCGVWQHTRCAGIEKYDGLPETFVCSRCMNTYCKENIIYRKVNRYRKKSKAIDFGNGVDRATLTGITCRDQTVATGRVGSGISLSVTFDVS